MIFSYNASNWWLLKEVIWYFLLERIVKHSEINHSDYYTISTQGVTHVRDSEAEFTALERWEKEHKDYKRLVKIPTFANFRMWKAFVVWRKNVKTKYASLHCINASYPLLILLQWYFSFWKVQSDMSQLCCTLLYLIRAATVHTCYEEWKPFFAQQFRAKVKHYWTTCFWH